MEEGTYKPKTELNNKNIETFKLLYKITKMQDETHMLIKINIFELLKGRSGPFLQEISQP